MWVEEFIYTHLKSYIYFKNGQYLGLGLGGTPNLLLVLPLFRTLTLIPDLNN
jgi:hypothetical protein